MSRDVFSQSYKTKLGYYGRMSQPPPPPHPTRGVVVEIKVQQSTARLSVIETLEIAVSLKRLNQYLN